jgi:hypothetical protein
VEVGLTRGRARVTSRARTEAFGAQTVGSGDARSEGYSVSLLRPPDRTGFFFPLRAGFFAEDIEIRGFRQDLPVFRVPGATEIPAVITDPATGARLDPADPNAYFLRLRSGYVGQGIGVNLVVGTDDVQLFATAQAAVDLLEVRHVDVTLDQARERGVSAVALGGVAAQGQLGLAIPALHAAVRVAGEVELRRDFAYPAPLEFRAGVAFDPDKQVFERQRVLVEGASVLLASSTVSLVVFY